MHTFKGKSANFMYNSDMSGDVIIVSNETDEMGELSIRASDIIGFVAEHVRREKISQLENASNEEILFGTMKIDINMPDDYVWVCNNEECEEIHEDPTDVCEHCDSDTRKVHKGDMDLD